MSPPVSGIIRLIRRSAVVLPEPDGPTRTHTSPAPTSRLRSTIAGSFWPGYCLETSRSTSSAACDNDDSPSDWAVFDTGKRKTGPGCRTSLLMSTRMDHLSHTRRLLVLGICCMSLLIVGLDTTIVNVALPSIHRDLHASVSGLQWTIDAYTLVLASLLMLAGSTADRIGRRRVFQIGLVVFAAGSLLCGLAPT